MTEKRLVLHIGTAKTATTAVQRALADNREALARQGVLYPVFPGAMDYQHWGLAAAATRALEFDVPFPQSQWTPTLHNLARGLEADAESKGCSTLLLSSEFLFSSPIAQGPIVSDWTFAHVRALNRRIQTAFAAWRIEVWLWIRRQDDFEESMLAQYARDGRPVHTPARMAAAPKKWLDYRRNVAALEDVFGRGNVHCRFFSKEASPLSELLGAAGVDTGRLTKTGSGRENVSLAPLFTALLFEINRAGLQGEARAEAAAEARRLAEASRAPRLFPAFVRREVMSNYAEGNAELAAHLGWTDPAHGLLAPVDERPAAYVEDWPVIERFRSAVGTP